MQPHNNSPKPSIAWKLLGAFTIAGGSLFSFSVYSINLTDGSDTDSQALADLSGEIRQLRDELKPPLRRADSQPHDEQPPSSNTPPDKSNKPRSWNDLKSHLTDIDKDAKARQKEKEDEVESNGWTDSKLQAELKEKCHESWQSGNTHLVIDWSDPRDLLVWETGERLSWNEVEAVFSDIDAKRKAGDATADKLFFETRVTWTPDNVFVHEDHYDQFHNSVISQIGPATRKRMAMFFHSSPRRFSAKYFNETRSENAKWRNAYYYPPK